MYVTLDVAAKCGCGFLLTEGSQAVKSGLSYGAIQ
jgi:hypothetical protein